jgi:dTMP kinase
MSYEVLPLSFPNYKEPWSLFVKMYLNAEFGDKPEDVNPYAASSFYAVDRFASFNKNWKYYYTSGKIILCDRYTTSNAVYQLSKFKKKQWESYINWLCDYEYKKLGLPEPDLTFYLDVPLNISQNLMLRRYQGRENKKDLHEKSIKFLKSSKEAASFSAKLLGWKFVNCCNDQGELRTTQSINQEIFDKILNVICSKKETYEQKI